MFLVFVKGESPFLDTDPQDGEDIRCVPVSVDPRSETCIRALLAVQSFEIAHSLAALVVSGVNAGSRSSSPPPG